MANDDSRAASAPTPDRAREREELMAQLADSQTALIRLLAPMAPVQDWQPEPAEWSFRYIAAHLAAVEAECHLQRVRQIATGKTPDIPNYRDKGVDFSQQELTDSLADWQVTRRTLLDFVSGLSVRALTYIGIHEKLGALSLLDALQEMVDQDQGHLRHIRRLISVYREEGSPPSTPQWVAPNGHTENGTAPLYTNHKHGAT